MSKTNLRKRTEFNVTAGNALIEANYSVKLTARAHKVARLILSLIKPSDTDLGLYKINIQTLKRYLGYNDGKKWGRFGSDLDDICMRLNNHPIHIPESGEKYTKAFFIASYTVDLAEQTVEFEISQKLKPYLIQLKGEFTSYMLSNIPKLRSSYSIRMYELLSQYKRIGKRTFDIEDLKKKLGCNYKSYGHFKDKAINKAQEDMQFYTDLKFEFEEHKTGRRITSMTFFISPNVPSDPVEESTQLTIFDSLNNTSKASGEIDRMVELGIPVDTAHRLFQKGFDLIEDEADREQARNRLGTVAQYFEEKFLLLQMTRKQGIVSSPSGFLITALKEDWIDPKVKPVIRVESNQKDEYERDRRNHEIALARTEICKEILEENPEILEVAYQSALAKMGDVGQGLAKGKSPLELFQVGGFVATFIEGELVALYPERFSKSLKAQDR